MSDEVYKYLIDKVIELFDINRYQGVKLIVFSILICLFFSTLIFAFMYFCTKKEEYKQRKQFADTIKDINEDSNIIKLYADLINHKDEKILKLENKICELEKRLEMVK